MRVDLGPFSGWRHDLAYCLHTTMAVVCEAHGRDPLLTLGAWWGFHHVPGPVPREEYYFPPHRPSLAASVAPYHPVRSRWHEPVDADTAWTEVRRQLSVGRVVAVAADNYHLPFRPAFGDVHTNHLLALTGFDDELGTVDVADAVPPAYAGPISHDQLMLARGSTNPMLHDRDLFYTAVPIGFRWLEVSFDDPWPVEDLDHVGQVLSRNLRGWWDPADPVHHGRGALEDYLCSLGDRVSDDPAVIDEIFIVGEAAVASTGIHADYLSAAAGRHGRSDWALVARLVDRVAHHWTALRITAASARGREGASTRALDERGRRMLDDLDQALATLAGSVEG